MSVRPKDEESTVDHQLTATSFLLKVNLVLLQIFKTPFLHDPIALPTFKDLEKFLSEHYADHGVQSLYLC